MECSLETDTPANPTNPVLIWPFSYFFLRFSSTACNSLQLIFTNREYFTTDNFPTTSVTDYFYLNSISADYFPLRIFSSLSYLFPSSVFLDHFSLTESIFQLWVFPLIFCVSVPSIFFHLFSLRVFFLQEFYIFLKYVYCLPLLYSFQPIFSSSVYFAATSSYNIIFPIMIISSFSVACLRKKLQASSTILLLFFTESMFPAKILYFSQDILLFSIISPLMHFSYSDSSSL